ncbi:MAG: FAD-binding domain-containing protein [Betaproteobacteria bacterium]
MHGAGPHPSARSYISPVRQGEKFDARGNYVRRWVPELEKLPDRWIHRPWQAPGLELAAAGVHPRRDHPLPFVDHAAARAPSLEAFTQINAEGLKLAADLDRCF